MEGHKRLLRIFSGNLPAMFTFIAAPILKIGMFLMKTSETNFIFWHVSSPKIKSVLKKTDV